MMYFIDIVGTCHLACPFAQSEILKNDELKNSELA